MLRTSARWYCLINGPTVLATCLVKSGSHLAVSRFFGVFAFAAAPWWSPQIVADRRCEHVTLVFGECHIRLLETDADLRERWPRRCLSQAVSAWSGRRPCAGWPPTGTAWLPPTSARPAQRRGRDVAAGRCRGALGEPHRAARGRPAHRRSGADGDRPPGRRDPAGDLSQPRTRPPGQRGCHRRLCCAPRRHTHGRRASCWPPAMLSTGRAIRIAIPGG